MFRKKEEIKNDEEALKKFAEVVAYMLKGGFNIKDIEEAVEVGELAYKRFLKEENIKTNPKFKVYEINAESKEEAINQIRQLELDKKVEKDIINILKNH